MIPSSNFMLFLKINKEVNLMIIISSNWKVALNNNFRFIETLFKAYFEKELLFHICFGKRKMAAILYWEIWWGTLNHEKLARWTIVIYKIWEWGTLNIGARWTTWFFNRSLVYKHNSYITRPSQMAIVLLKCHFKTVIFIMVIGTPTKVQGAPHVGYVEHMNFFFNCVF